MAGVVHREVARLVFDFQGKRGDGGCAAAPTHLVPSEWFGNFHLIIVRTAYLLDLQNIEYPTHVFFSVLIVGSVFLPKVLCIPWVGLLTLCVYVLQVLD